MRRTLLVALVVVVATMLAMTLGRGGRGMSDGGLRASIEPVTLVGMSDGGLSSVDGNAPLGMSDGGL